MQRLLLAALAICAATLLAACGGGDSPSNPDTLTPTITGSPQAIAPPIPPTPAFASTPGAPGTSDPSAPSPPGGGNIDTSIVRATPSGTAVRIDPAPGTRLPNPAPIRDADVRPQESSPP